VLGNGPCGGDGGEPYAADGSPQRAVCEVLGGALQALPLVAAVVGITAAVITGASWARHGRGLGPYVVALAVSLAAGPFVAWVASLPANQ